MTAHPVPGSTSGNDRPQPTEQSEQPHSATSPPPGALGTYRAVSAPPQSLHQHNVFSFNADDATSVDRSANDSSRGSGHASTTSTGGLSNSSTLPSYGQSFSNSSASGHSNSAVGSQRPSPQNTTAAYQQQWHAQTATNQSLRAAPLRRAESAQTAQNYQSQYGSKQSADELTSSFQQSMSLNDQSASNYASGYQSQQQPAYQQRQTVGYQQQSGSAGPYGANMQRGYNAGNIAGIVAPASNYMQQPSYSQPQHGQQQQPSHAHQRGNNKQRDNRFQRKDRGYIQRAHHTYGGLLLPNITTGVGGTNFTINPALLPIDIDLSNDGLADIRQLQGHIYILAKDQHGCRLVQAILDMERNENRRILQEREREKEMHRSLAENDASAAATDSLPPVKLSTHAVDVVCVEIFPHLNELLTDPFGNYLCQKVIEYGSEEQRYALIQRIAADLVAISLNMHGTRAIQRLVEMMSSQREIDAFVASVKSSVITLIKDLNGNHVIQRCLHHFTSANNDFIYTTITRHCVSVCTHKHGCCVMQRCIDYANITQKKSVIHEIIVHCLELACDSFGNYIVQYILDLGDSTVCESIAQQLYTHVADLSTQKCSSNVIEKCLELCSESTRMNLINEMYEPTRLPQLLQDNYANFVLQKTLTVVDKKRFPELANKLKPHLQAIRGTHFGKRLIQKLVKKFPQVQWIENGGAGDVSEPAWAAQQHHSRPPLGHSQQSQPVLTYQGGNASAILPPAVMPIPAANITDPNQLQQLQAMYVQQLQQLNAQIAAQQQQQKAGQQVGASAQPMGMQQAFNMQAPSPQSYGYGGPALSDDAYGTMSSDSLGRAATPDSLLQPQHYIQYGQQRMQPLPQQSYIQQPSAQHHAYRSWQAQTQYHPDMSSASPVITPLN